jgi:hypothetical protein
MFAQHTLPHIQTPIFLLQSPFDSWQLQWEHGERKYHNHYNATALNQYGNALSATMAASLQAAARNPVGTRVGGFIDHCYHHTYAYNSLWSAQPRISGLTAAAAFSIWFDALREGQRAGGEGWAGGVLWQEGAFPCFSCDCPVENGVGPAPPDWPG